MMQQEVYELVGWGMTFMARWGITLLLWIALGLTAAVLVWFLVTQGRQSAEQRERAIEAKLRRRYATGEIDLQELIRRLQKLRRAR